MEQHVHDLAIAAQTSTPEIYPNMMSEWTGTSLFGEVGKEASDEVLRDRDHQRCQAVGDGHTGQGVHCRQAPRV